VLHVNPEHGPNAVHARTQRKEHSMSMAIPASWLRTKGGCKRIDALLWAGWTLTVTK
jgi:hypothetical protein